MDAYYLDDRLSLAEGTCRFPTNGLGRENIQEGFYALAIRRSGYRDCLFRFSNSDQAGARLMLAALNRQASVCGMRSAQAPVELTASIPDRGSQGSRRSNVSRVYSPGHG